VGVEPATRPNTACSGRRVESCRAAADAKRVSQTIPMLLMLQDDDVLRLYESVEAAIRDVEALDPSQRDDPNR